MSWVTTRNLFENFAHPLDPLILSLKLDGDFGSWFQLGSFSLSLESGKAGEDLLGAGGDSDKPFNWVASVKVNNALGTDGLVALPAVRIDFLVRVLVTVSDLVALVPSFRLSSTVMSWW